MTVTRAVTRGRVFVPDEVDTLSPGPALAALLDGVDLRRLVGEDVVRVTRAFARLAAHYEALTVTGIVEIAHCPHPTDASRTPEENEFAEREVAAALSLTKRQAGKQLAFGRDLRDRLPTVLQAWRDGRIDAGKAWIFREVVTPVTDVEDVGLVVGLVLPDAPGLTTAEIARRLRKNIAAVAPDAAVKRAERAQRHRRLACGVDRDGSSAWLTAVGLPVQKAAAAWERVDGFARALRERGDERSLDQLRADVALELLDGSYRGPAPIFRRGVVELTVPLTTLMELTDLPGELAGWGPVCADIARKTFHEMPGRSGMRFVVQDEDGVVVAGGRGRHRPAAITAQTRAARCAAPGCGRPARQGQVDHQRPRPADGSTTGRSVAPLCAHDRRAKYKGGWRYIEVTPGRYVWTSPLGQQYVVDRRTDPDKPSPRRRLGTPDSHRNHQR